MEFDLLEFTLEEFEKARDEVRLGMGVSLMFPDFARDFLELHARLLFTLRVILLEKKVKSLMKEIENL